MSELSLHDWLMTFVERCLSRQAIVLPAHLDLHFQLLLLPPLSFTRSVGYPVTQASAEYISFTHIAQALHIWVHNCHITRQTAETEFYQWVYQNSSLMGEKDIFQNASLWIKSQLKNPVGGPDTEAILKKLNLKW